MDTRSIFHTAFVARNYQNVMDEDFVYQVFEITLYDLSEKIEARFGEEIPNPNMILSYIAGEYMYIVAPLNKDNQEKLLKDEVFAKKFSKSIADKIFFNEYLSYRARPLINKYNPLISTLRFYLNFILNRFTVIRGNSDDEVLMLDMLRKAFLSCQGISSLLVEGFETEAFSTWRTIHETECMVKIVFDHREVVPTYRRHMEYNRAFRNEYEDKDEQQSVIDEIKGHLRAHDLKSKDLKKYIEYGWLFSINSIDELYPDLKLNFRNGVELIAGLSSYSSLYEMSSEIAHSSPILIYSNKPYFLEITIISLYETFLRMEEIFNDILLKLEEQDSSGYFAMRKLYLPEMKMMLAKEKIMFGNHEKKDWRKKSEPSK